ncbi:hypothetical protein HMPREF1486_06436 [Streptomyces sp. HPH0547]|nr:hypothetical protein HMPREF1486_06436 [Streptomyces sp. HPH0547]
MLGLQTARVVEPGQHLLGPRGHQRVRVGQHPHPGEGVRGPLVLGQVQGGQQREEAFQDAGPATGQQPRQAAVDQHVAAEPSLFGEPGERGWPPRLAAPAVLEVRAGFRHFQEPGDHHRQERVVPQTVPDGRATGRDVELPAEDDAVRGGRLAAGGVHQPGDQRIGALGDGAALRQPVRHPAQPFWVAMPQRFGDQCGVAARPPQVAGGKPPGRSRRTGAASHPREPQRRADGNVTVVPAVPHDRAPRLEHRQACAPLGVGECAGQLRYGRLAALTHRVQSSRMPCVAVPGMAGARVSLIGGLRGRRRPGSGRWPYGPRRPGGRGARRGRACRVRGCRGVRPTSGRCRSHVARRS